MLPLMSVLVVEDDAATRRGYVKLLVRSGLEVIEARDGQQALDLLESGVRPNVVLLDLSLPRVTGRELIGQLHSDPAFRHVPIIVVTGAVDTQAPLMADVILTKPIDGRELVETVRAAHDKHKS
jgi:chemosensory pili system protein ChpA (sensor histidine kinase/response regulator)